MAHLIDHWTQSSSVKSYVSAIKKMVSLVDYEWDNNKIMLSSLTKACRLINDQISIRLRIFCSMLELILFEVGRLFNLTNQPYLNCHYETLFAVGYYRLMRVGEVTFSEHAVKAWDVHLATNKNKILLVLYSSKAHKNSPIRG